MNVALSFDQTAYSVLASFGFTLLYSICSLAAGRAVDVLSRKGTTVLACFSWSAVTAAQGLANSFPEVFGLRVLQGIAQVRLLHRFCNALYAYVCVVHVHSRMYIISAT
jgi:MFS family permease